MLHTFAFMFTFACVLVFSVSSVLHVLPSCVYPYYTVAFASTCPLRVAFALPPWPCSDLCLHIHYLGCDIHTQAHAQDSSYNTCVEEMGTTGSWENYVWQGYRYEYHSSLPELPTESECEPCEANGQDQDLERLFTLLRVSLSIYACLLDLFGTSGMWCLRMWGLNNIVDRPSTIEGVLTSHLKLMWVRGLEHSSLKPHILKHHIPEHPICGTQASGHLFHVCVSLSFRQPLFQTIAVTSSKHVVMRFVSSESLKCRLLEWLLDHPMRVPG